MNFESYHNLGDTVGFFHKFEVPAFTTYHATFASPGPMDSYPDTSASRPPNMFDSPAKRSLHCRRMAELQNTPNRLPYTPYRLPHHLSSPTMESLNNDVILAASNLRISECSDFSPFLSDISSPFSSTPRSAPVSSTPSGSSSPSSSVTSQQILHFVFPFEEAADLDRTSSSSFAAIPVLINSINTSPSPSTRETSNILPTDVSTSIIPPPPSFTDTDYSCAECTSCDTRADYLKDRLKTRWPGSTNHVINPLKGNILQSSFEEEFISYQPHHYVSDCSERKDQYLRSPAKTPLFQRSPSPLSRRLIEWTKGVLRK